MDNIPHRIHRGTDDGDGTEGETNPKYDETTPQAALFAVRPGKTVDTKRHDPIRVEKTPRKDGRQSHQWNETPLRD